MEFIGLCPLMGLIVLLCGMVLAAIPAKRAVVESDPLGEAKAARKAAKAALRAAGHSDLSGNLAALAVSSPNPASLPGASHPKGRGNRADRRSALVRGLFDQARRTAGQVGHRAHVGLKRDGRVLSPAQTALRAVLAGRKKARKAALRAAAPAPSVLERGEGIALARLCRGLQAWALARQDRAERVHRAQALRRARAAERQLRWAEARMGALYERLLDARQGEIEWWDYAESHQDSLGDAILATTHRRDCEQVFRLASRAFKAMISEVA